MSELPTRQNDVRVALMQSLNTATSMLKEAAEKGVAPNTLIDADLFKMFIATFEEVTARASAEIYPPLPVMTPVQTRKAEAKEDLKKLNGDRPYDGGSNMVRDDGFFAKSLEEKYGMTLGKLAVWSDYRNSGGKPFWDSPTSIDYLMTHPDDEEVRRILKDMTTREFTPADWKAIYKCRDRLWKAEKAKPVA